MVNLDINEIVREVLLLTASETQRRKVEVTTDLSTILPPVLGDRVQLLQVMLNLIMNSLDAMNSITDRSRQLCITSSTTPNCVLIQVKDSGQGWNPQHANSIFDPFFTTKKDGIGMGLTISRSIVEAHGGRLWPEAGTPHGAILNFTLPSSSKAE